MNIQISIDDASVKEMYKGLEQQLPSILNRTINNSLLSMQTSNVSHIKDVFTIRREQFLKRSVKITKFSKPTDLTGTIAIADMGSSNTADIFSKFELGGNKTPHKGKNIAIPSSNVKPSKSGVIPSSRRPSHLKRSFKIDDNIFVRKGKKKIELMYSLKPSVRIDNRLNFVRTSEETFNKVMSKHYADAYAHALAKYQK